MAHRIEKHDKQQGIKQAWHGLTEIMPEITLENNWLAQWEVESRPLFFGDKSPAPFAVLGATDVQDLLIGGAYNPDTFKPIDNKAFLQLVRDSISGTNHKIVSVGSVRNRGRVFLSIELAGMEKFKAAGRDFSAFLNFGNGHDKSSVLWVSTSNVCTVCDNTYSMNLVQVENKENKDSGDDVKLRLRHTKHAEIKLPTMAKLIDRAIGVQAEFQIELDKLAQVTVKQQVAENLFAGFIGRNVADVKDGLSTRARNTVSRLMSLHNDGLGNRGETLADSFQAVTEYYTRESANGAENKEKQFVSSEFGAGLQAKQTFWNTITNPDKREQTIERGESLLTIAAN